MRLKQSDMGPLLPTGEKREYRFSLVLRKMLRTQKLAVVSAGIILLLFLGAVLAPLLTPYGETEMDLMNRLAPPSAAHLLGTDEGGRDILTRMLYGARISLLTGVAPTIMSLLLGTALGMLSGLRGGKCDTLIMRAADVMLAFPSILLAMVIMYTLGDGLMNVFLTLTLVNWAEVSRVIRAETLQMKTSEYMEAARVIGVSRGRILLRHVLPNCLPTMIVLFTLGVPTAILTESSMSFLGLGLQPPFASWGRMVNAGRQYLFNAPWLCFAPGAAIMISAMAFYFLGNGLRDVLDPRMRG